MAIAQGFGKTVSNGLIFGYDTGDMDNSYRGAPGQNYAIGPNRSYSGLSVQNFDNGKIIRSNGYTETVFIPTLGMRTVESVEWYNEYDGYGTNGNYNCCPTLFTYNPGGWNSFTWLPNTTYTYQIIYKSETGYTNSNYMYHYEYQANGTYITEFGVHTEGLRTHLGDGWYHAWNTFTTNPLAAMGYCGCWHYEYYGRNKLSIAAVSIVPGTTIRPPRQFIDEGTTRTATQGLLDLVGVSTIDLTNVSYGSNGELRFDGTDDAISITRPSSFSGSGTWTIETWFKINGAPSSTAYMNVIVDMDPTGGSANMICVNWSDMRLQYRSRPVGGSYTDINGSILSQGVWYNATVVRDGTSSTKLYLNGVQDGGTYSGNLPAGNQATFNIGRWTDGTVFANANIPIVRIYNRALTQAELTQNYNHYKTRFGL